VCIATVGGIRDGEGIVHWRNGAYTITGTPSMYTVRVLKYFCKVALGIECDEPEELTERRPAIALVR
jgi:hypothetical protein